MGALTTKCPSCSTNNEVDTEILAAGARVISCWNCATQVPITQVAVVAARKKPSIHSREAVPQPASLSTNYPTARLRRSGGTEWYVKAVLGVGVLVVLMLIITVTVVVSSSGSSGAGSEFGQFRATYHIGDALPTGTEAWRAEIASDSGFAVARTGETIFAVANEVRNDAAAEYTPDGIPAELLAPLRKVHSEMILKGYELLGSPGKTALQESQRERFFAKLKQGNCYNLNVVGGEKSIDIDLLLYHSDGVRLIMADTRGERDASLEYCPISTETFEYEVKMHKGYGLVSTVIYRQVDSFLHEKGHLYAINAAKGQKIWTKALEDQVSSSVTANETHVVFGTRSKRRSKATHKLVEDGRLMVFSVQDGSQICSFDALGPVLSTPILREGVAYFGSCGESTSQKTIPDVCDTSSPSTGRVYAVKAADCSLLWSHTTEYPVIEAPSTNGNALFVASGSSITAIDLENGSPRWTKDVHSTPGPPVGVDTMVVFGTEGGSIRALDTKNGEIIWFFEAETPVRSTPAIVNDTIFAGCHDGSLLALAASSGERLWSVRVDSPINSPIGAASGIVFGLARDVLLVVDIEEGRSRFEFPVEATNSERSSAILVNGLIIFSDSAGTVYALR